MILNAEEAHFLQEHPIIKVAIDPNWYPLEFVDEYGQASGISADYLKKLEQLLGIKLEAEIGTSWPEALEKVRNRQLDMIAMAAPTPERLNYVSFTNPYIRAPMIIVTQDNQDYIDDISRLKGRTVLVVKGYASEDWIRSNYPEIKIQQTESTLHGLELVSTGQAYALIDNLVAANFLIRNNGLSNLKISGQLPISFNLSMAARNDWPLLRGILQKGLDAISPEESDAIYNRWIRLQYNSEINYKKILPYFAGLLALLLLMTWDSIRFRRLNKKLHTINTQLQQTETQLKQKNQALEMVSITDRLTGAFNRMKLETELERVRAEAVLYQTPVCLVLFDLDHFKNVNDRFGHNAGDEVLRTFAALVQHSIRKSDIFGRWGGEEFLLIFPNTSLKETFGLAERIRISLADIETLPSGKQTLSAGAAAWRPNQSLEEWLGTCDALLYQAKSCGRNRIHGDFLTPSYTSAG